MGAPNFALFFHLPPQFSFFLLSLGGLLVEFSWCFETPGSKMCPFGVLGLSCPGGFGLMPTLGPSAGLPTKHRRPKAGDVSLESQLKVQGGCIGVQVIEVVLVVSGGSGGFWWFLMFLLVLGGFLIVFLVFFWVFFGCCFGCCLGVFWCVFGVFFGCFFGVCFWCVFWCFLSVFGVFGSVFVGAEGDHIRVRAGEGGGRKRPERPVTSNSLHPIAP